MTTTATLLTKLMLDTSDYDKGIQGAKNKASGFEDTMKNIGGKMQNIGAKMTAGITLPIIGAGAAVINSASDMGESVNAVNTVFEEGAGIIEEYSKTSAQTVGLAAQDFNQLSAVTGSFLQNLGYDAEGAAQETIKLTERASDMASVFNTDVEQALGAIQSGLKGEFNPLENFGVKMNMAGIEAKALAMGLVPLEKNELKIRESALKVTEAQEKLNDVLSDSKSSATDIEKAQIALEKAQINLEGAMEGSTTEITDNMKAQAALALIMEQTDRISGDFANTSDQLANSQRIMKAEIKDMSAELGQALLPIALQVVTVIRDLVDRFRNLSPEQQKVILLVAGFLAILGPVITVLGTLISVIGAVGGFITGSLFAPVMAVIGVLALLYLAWKNNWGGIQDKLKAVWAAIQPVLQMVWAWLKEKIPLAIQALKQFWDTVLLPAIMKVWAWIKANLIPLFEAIGRVIFAVIIVAFRALVGLWQNVVFPALQKLWGWIQDKIVPILKVLWDWLVSKIKPAFDGISRVIQTVIGWFRNLADKIMSIKLPSWLTPGSPTPFEMGLRGINKELQKMSVKQLPTLTANLDFGVPQSIPAPAYAGAGGGGQSIVFEPGSIVVNDQASGERVLTLLKSIMNGEVI